MATRKSEPPSMTSSKVRIRVLRICTIVATMPASPSMDGDENEGKKSKRAAKKPGGFQALSLRNEASDAPVEVLGWCVA